MYKKILKQRNDLLKTMQKSENKDMLLLHHYLKILILKCQTFFKANETKNQKNNKNTIKRKQQKKKKRQS